MNDNFKPLDLNKESVNDIYLSCRPSPKTKKTFHVIFQQKDFGFPSNSDPLILDADEIDKNISNIFYLFGQLQTIHSISPDLPIKDVLKKYDGTFWTNDKATPIILLHLGIASGIIMPPDARSKASLLSLNAKPTYSPNDPMFENWFKSYKPITLTDLIGQEPGDE